MPTGAVPANPGFQFVSSTGTPLAAGTVTVYLAGTTTPTDTWQDDGLTTLNTNPIVLDAAGRCTIWLSPTLSYKFVVKNALGVTQTTIDDIPGVTGGPGTISLTNTAGADTITATSAVSLNGYAAGQRFSFVAAASNTGAVTLNVNGLGAKALTKSGTTALVAGDITSGQVVEVVYDGTRFQGIGLRSSTAVRIALQSFTATGTYTPAAGMQYCVVQMVGGGGGGTQNSSGNFGGGGGGAGEYATGVFTAADIGVNKAVTIGAGGAAGATGGTTSLGALLTAIGGSSRAAGNSAGGVGGTGGTGTGFRSPGGMGMNGIGAAGAVVQGGSGGASFFGTGGRGGSGALDNASAGTAYGSGGGGNGFDAAWGTAGAGASGCVLITEYL